MQVKFLGGAREVGRIGIAVKSEKTQVLLDYGVMLDHEPGFPMHVPPKEVDAVILTHSHLDHSGAIPIFYVDGKRPLYTNRLNLELTQLLIRDFIHLSGYYLPFEYLELETMMRSNKHLDFGRETTVYSFRNIRGTGRSFWAGFSPIGRSSPTSGRRSYDSDSARFPHLSCLQNPRSKDHIRGADFKFPAVSFSGFGSADALQWYN